MPEKGTGNHPLFLLLFAFHLSLCFLLSLSSPPPPTYFQYHPKMTPVPKNHHQTLYNTTTSAVHTRVAFAPKGHSGASLSLFVLTGVPHSNSTPPGSLDYTRILHTFSFLFFFFLLLPKNKKNLDGSPTTAEMEGGKAQTTNWTYDFEYIKKKKGGTFCVWMAAT